MGLGGDKQYLRKFSEKSVISKMILGQSNYTSCFRNFIGKVSWVMYLFVLMKYFEKRIKTVYKFLIIMNLKLFLSFRLLFKIWYRKTWFKLKFSSRDPNYIITFWLNWYIETCRIFSTSYYFFLIDTHLFKFRIIYLLHTLFHHLSSVHL